MKPEAFLAIGLQLIRCSCAERDRCPFAIRFSYEIRLVIAISNKRQPTIGHVTRIEAVVRQSRLKNVVKQIENGTRAMQGCRFPNAGRTCRSGVQNGRDAGLNHVDIGQTIDPLEQIMGVVIAQQRRCLFVVFHQTVAQAFFVIVSPAFEIS